MLSAGFGGRYLDLVVSRTTHSNALEIALSHKFPPHLFLAGVTISGHFLTY